MQILPPDLVQYSADRYYRDLAYREEVDRETIGERQVRLLLLFDKLLPYNVDIT